MDEARIRIDRWLWHARFYRTRPLAQRACEAGVIWLNGRRVEKPGMAVKPGDIITAPLGRGVAAVRILACGHRRGPAPEAQLLYARLDETGLELNAPLP